MNLEKYLMILILRTLGFSQDEVAGLVHCAKQTVVDAERWFMSRPHGEALALVDDQRIKRLVGREFPDMGLTPNQLIKTGQVTGDNILLHYGRVHPDEDKSAGAVVPLGESRHVAIVDSVRAKLLERHWDRLRKQAIILRTQLSPPNIEVLFEADVCRKLHGAIESGSSLLSTSSWTKIIDAPLELKLCDSVEQRTVEVRLSVEEEFLFPHLASHLQAESGQFSQFEAWKSQLGRLMETCVQIAERVPQNCRVAAGMYYLGRSRQKGLLWHFPAYVCQFVFNHPYSEIMPRLHTELQPDGLWKLMPEESPAITLAVDTAEHIHRCQEVLVKEVRDNAGLQVWRQISSDLTELRAKSEQLQTMLTTVIERGNFKGTCSLCEGYFTSSQSA